MSRVALERALKKPGRVLTWHAGSGCRSHRSSERADYYTVLPPELAGFVHRFGSDTTEPEVLELFLDDMLHELAAEEAEFRALHADDPLVPTMPAGAVLFEIRGYFQGCLEFYVTQHAVPATDPFRRGPEPRWLILASPQVRSAEQCAAAFDDLLDRCDDVARLHDLILDLETVRDGFRSMLRRKTAVTRPDPVARTAAPQL
jgi:hypothetical protein